MCGEKKVMRGAKDKRMGSPPHVRGKALDRNAPQMRLGDHPRMCGEKRKILDARP